MRKDIIAALEKFQPKKKQFVKNHRRCSSFWSYWGNHRSSS